MEEALSRVYALLDELKRVTRIEGEYTLPQDLSSWTLIEEGAPCDRLNLAQSHYLEKPLTEEHGVYVYKYNGTAIVERTQEEINADIIVPITEPTIEERINDLEIAICEIIDVISE